MDCEFPLRENSTFRNFTGKFYRPQNFHKNENPKFLKKLHILKI